jgi:glycosyltransferase involved in cell wall biosynthesis
MKNVTFFKIGSFSLINDTLWKALPAAMTEYQWRLVDVENDIVRAQPSLHLRATIEALARYGNVILSNRQPPRDFFPRIPCVLEAIRQWSAREAGQSHTAFTFQTQSLFDASVGGIPHFSYTDHTYLANQRYPVPRPSLRVPEQWLQMERSLYRESTRTFVLSEFARMSVIEDYHVDPSRVSCVHSGCNVPLPDTVDFSKRSGNVILFMGVDWERKGGPELLEAFRAVKRSRPNAELWIVGCDPGARDAGIRTFGRLPADQAAECYRTADIFCLPSRMDPSASVLLEAAGYALPVVATRVGGNLERVIDGKSGFLCDPADLAARLSELLDDRALREAMGSAGRANVFERFTWERVAARIADQIRSDIA